MNGEPKAYQETVGVPPAGGLPSSVIREVEKLYRNGLCIKAYKRTLPFGPPQSWIDCRSGIWGGRLAANLGARQLSRVIHWRNYKRHRNQLDACAYFAHVIMERFGPLAAARFQNTGCPSEIHTASLEAQVYFLTLRASVAQSFRDFVTADEWLTQAERMHTDQVWIRVVRSQLLERQDRYEESLEFAWASLTDDKCYRPGIQQTAHLLQVLDRDEEALSLLRTTSAQMENSAVTAQLAVLEQELELYDDALNSYDRCIELAPLAERRYIDWINSNRVTIACRQQTRPRALELARTIDDTYHKELVGRLQNPEHPQERVQLKVPFVRQHDMTCAPATLSALSRFWNLPAEHLSLAEEICYDGTPAHSERHWAETHGYVVREFTVTWNAARELLDCGIPFTMTTVETTSGHLQAVVGYDTLRGALLMRDPFNYYTSEALCPKFLERYASTGPRGMVMVPESRANLLNGMELPDEELYTSYHSLNRALHQHQREQAVNILDEMKQTSPEHRLTLMSQWVLSAYDANTPALLEAVETLLARYPEANHLLHSKLTCLTELSRRQERIDFLHALAHRPGTDPFFWLTYAQELRLDGREMTAAANWARWNLRYRPTDPESLKTYADVLWSQRKFEPALELYRLAACGNPRHEGYARSYFLGARHLRQTSEALAFLKERFAQFGRMSPWPALTLVNGLLMLSEVPNALAMLDEALALRPGDGSLLLFASDTYARNGDWEKADEYLGQAEGRTARSEWLRSAATLADYRCDRQKSLTMWREILTIQPLALDANRIVSQLITELEDRTAALNFLKNASARFPNHCGLLGLLAEMAAPEPPSVREPILLQLIDINPADAWAHRELALLLRTQRRFDEAVQSADTAIELEPGAAPGYCTRGEVLLALGQGERARADFESAIRLSVDTSWAVNRFMVCCEDTAARIRALDFVHSELVRQVVFGEALSAYREAARGVLDPETVLTRMSEAREARPDLWEAWMEEAAQLRDMGRLDAGLEMIKSACERFPFLPRIWVERAELHRVRFEADEAITALEQALAINPGYGEASRRLSAVALQMNDFDRARETLEHAIVHSPLDPYSHGALADVLWRQGRKEEALDQMRRALRLEPGYDWGWQVLDEWATAACQPELALEMARGLVEHRPGEARSHMRLAEILIRGNRDEALTCAERAVELAPEIPETHDLKARILALDNQIDAARTCCHPPNFSERPPSLMIREAWVESVRGDLTRAVAVMKDALAIEPAHIGGWQFLSEWLVALEELDEAEKAAERLAELSPNDPASLGYAANINLIQENRNAAIGKFRRAFRLDPHYQYAGLNLFDILLEDGDSPGAEEVLQTLIQHGDNEYVWARRVRLLKRQHKAKEALQVFERIGRNRARDSWALFAASSALVDVGMGRRVDALVKRLIREQGINQYLGALWVSRRFQRKSYSPGRQMKHFVARGEIGDHALVQYLDSAALYHGHLKQRDDFTGPRSIRFWANRVLKRYQERCDANDDVWGKAGYYLMATNQYRKLATVCGDWRNRKSPEGWMLFNLASGLQLINQPDEARSVIQHALGLRMESDLYRSFSIRAAFDAACEGDAEASHALLAQGQSAELPKLDTTVNNLTHLILDGIASSEEPAVFQRKLRGGLRSAGDGRPFYYQPPLARRYFWRTIKVLENNTQFPGLAAWAWWSYLGPGALLGALGLVACPMVLIIGIAINDVGSIVGGSLGTLVFAAFLKR